MKTKLYPFETELPCHFGRRVAVKAQVWVTFEGRRVYQTELDYCEQKDGEDVTDDLADFERDAIEHDAWLKFEDDLCGQAEYEAEDWRENVRATT